MSDKNIVHIAVAVIENSHGQYFIAKRPEKSHQGGLWEFPGGKVEKNETVLDALKRELFEEVGITLLQANPLIRIHHDYPDKSVLLDVWRINDYSGNAFGKEFQETRWIDKNQFSEYDFPQANLPIITSIKLPDKYMITGNFENEKELLTRIQSGLNKGIKLIQFRAHHLSEEAYYNYAEKIYAACEKKHAVLLLNTAVEKYNKHKAHQFSHGLHLSVKEINYFSPDSLENNLLVSTSIHNEDELFIAEKKKIDFMVLSPVKKTQTHPNSIPIGWKSFNQISEKAHIPVYALGGMKENDIAISKENGAQGIAAIGGFWGIC